MQEEVKLNMKTFLTDLVEFDKLSNKYGSPFETIKRIANLTRLIEYKHQYIPLTSRTISCVIRKENLKELPVSKHTEKQTIQSIIDSYLETVLDDDIVRSVNRSIKSSIQQNHLVYLYETTSSYYTKSRIRVLCRMIWEDIQQHQKGNYIHG